MYTVEHLDMKICDFEKEASNTQTLREFIKESELDLFGKISRDEVLNSMSPQDLTAYVEQLDYLWEK